MYQYPGSFIDSALFGTNRNLSQVLTGGTAQSWTKPNNCLFHSFFLIGAGGGGRDASTTTGGGGGGSGGFLRIMLPDILIFDGFKFDIGLSGAPGVAGGATAIRNYQTSTSIASAGGGGSGTVSGTGGSGGSVSVGGVVNFFSFFQAGSGSTGGTGGGTIGAPPTSATVVSGGAGGSGNGSTQKGAGSAIPYMYLLDESVNPMRIVAEGGDLSGGTNAGRCAPHGFTVYDPIFFSTGGSGGGGATGVLGQQGGNGGVGSGGGGGGANATVGGIGGFGGNGIVFIWSS